MAQGRTALNYAFGPGAMLRLILMFCLLAGGAGAQQSCGPRSVIVENLREKYNERSRAGGVINHIELVEIWWSDATGAWTLMQTNVFGFSCVMASGSHFRLFVEEKEPPGDDG